MESVANAGSAGRTPGSKTDAPFNNRKPIDVVGTRVIAGLILAGCVAILSVGAYLTPSPAGVGSHEQLGLPPCSFLAVTGYPCATCGMTTAVAHVAHGHLLMAFYTQPAGALFGLSVVAGALISGYSLVTACSLSPIGRWLWRPRVICAIAAIVALAWIYKIILVRESL